MTVTEQARIPTKPTSRSTHRRSGKHRPWLGEFVHARAMAVGHPTHPSTRSRRGLSPSRLPGTEQFRRDVSGRGLAADSRIWPLRVAS